jgi:predicted metal-dependent HD superfamily phosphohydrolase
MSGLMIKDEFLKSLSNYTTDNSQQFTLWNEIEKSYSKSDRHYHNLTHLEAVLNELSIHKTKFTSWDAIVFAIAYHDIVYNTLKSNNEERSADLAIKRLSSTSFPAESIVWCGELIRATKKHEPADYETNLFTDADLSILGSDFSTYNDYAKKIRREYSIYPDLVYNPGRKKVLLHFLEMKSIFKTKEFSDKYELSAKANIQSELNSLTKGSPQAS